MPVSLFFRMSGAVLLAFPLSFVGFVAAEAKGNSGLESVRKTLQGKKSFQVKFRQEISQDLFPEEIENASGRVEFEKPRNLRWIYESPEKKEIRYEKGRAFVVRGKEKPEEIPDARALGIEESFSFLWGEASQDLFRVKTLASGQLELKPRHPEKAQFESLTIDVKDGKVQRAKVLDRLGGSSVLIFYDWKFSS